MCVRYLLLALRFVREHVGSHEQSVITARCTIVQSAVLLLHAVCLSSCLSVCDVGGL